jgi:hypothetical protein
MIQCPSNNCALNSIDTTTAATVACPVTSLPVPPG